MTTPAIGATTTATDTDITAADSPVLGQQPDRGAGVADVQADPDAPTVEADAEPKPSVATYRDQAGRVHYASPYSKATRTRVDAGDWSEVDPADLPAAEEIFDPTSELVRDVVTHLEQHADDPAEIERVKAAEKAGENRPTIRDWSPDQ